MAFSAAKFGIFRIAPAGSLMSCWWIVKVV